MEFGGGICNVSERGGDDFTCWKGPHAKEMSQMVMATFSVVEFALSGSGFRRHLL